MKTTTHTFYAILLVSLLGMVSGMLLGCRSDRLTTKMTEAPALRYAWEFASSIPNNPKQKAKTQQRVAEAHLKRGDIESAVTCGQRIENWRKGVVLAKAAGAYAQRGDDERAIELLAMAERIRNQTTDWPVDRVRLSITEARALLEQAGQVESVNNYYRNNESYVAQAGAYKATALAKQGKVKDAFDVIETVAAKSNHYDTRVGCVEGYLAIANLGGMETADRIEAIRRAHEAVDKIPGNKQHELRLEISRTAAEHGNHAQFRAILDATRTAIVESKFAPFIKAPLVLKLMHAYARCGDREAVETLLPMAKTLMDPEHLSITETPMINALLAEVYMELGEQDLAQAHFATALDITEAQVNPRPRAIEAVDVCLALSRSKFGVEAFAQRLDGLLGSFDAAASQ